jgi:hypothetical protein
MPLGNAETSTGSTAKPVATSHRARLAHFAIFNPSIKPTAQNSTAVIGLPVGDDDSVQHVNRDGAQADLAAHRVGGDGNAQAGPKEEKEIDKDDLEQAAQIVFYTAPSGGNAPRDVILRQVGLVRGLMAFTSYVSHCNHHPLSPYKRSYASSQAD